MTPGRSLPLDSCALVQCDLPIARPKFFSFFRGRENTPTFVVPRRARRCVCRVFRTRGATQRAEFFGRGCRSIPNWPIFRAPRSTCSAVRARAQFSPRDAVPPPPLADRFRIANELRTPRHGNRARPLHTRCSLLAPRCSLLAARCSVRPPPTNSFLSQPLFPTTTAGPISTSLFGNRARPKLGA